MDMAGNGIAMTPKDGGVDFDLDGDGSRERISWTGAQSDDAVLVMDVDGSGRIENGLELIGRQFRLSSGEMSPDGATVLAYQLQGLTRGQRPVPQGAAQLNRDDPYFSRLQLWTDGNHDGRTSADELTDFDAANVVRIFTGFLRIRSGTPRNLDAVGNRRLFEGTFAVVHRGVEFTRQLVELEPRR
jgi:hypothetical protein